MLCFGIYHREWLVLPHHEIGLLHRMARVFPIKCPKFDLTPKVVDFAKIKHQDLFPKIKQST
jgi:hypothetical protein